MDPNAQNTDLEGLLPDPSLPGANRGPAIPTPDLGAADVVRMQLLLYPQESTLSWSTTQVLL